MQTRVKKALKGLVIIARFCPVAKHLADVTVGSFFALITMVSGVGRGVGHLHLCGTVLCVMKVEAVTDVTEQPWGRLLLHRFFIDAAEKER